MTISPDNVVSLKINYKCLEPYPCEHKCEIALKNNWIAQTRLNKKEIATLLKEIDSTRVIFYHQDCLISSPHKFKSSTNSKAKQILTDVFARCLFDVTKAKL